MKFKDYLFDFSSSYSGGGLKRLMAYSKWFNEQDGSTFIVHENTREKLSEFTKNEYYYVNTSNLSKFRNNKSYLIEVLSKAPKPRVYYSYNIPLAYNVAPIQWFHLSNVLPLITPSSYNIPLKRNIELLWLGFLIRKGLKYATVISAESKFSTMLFKDEHKDKLRVSLNGSDDEIAIIENLNNNNYLTKNTAVIVGTYHHKNLPQAYSIFKTLQKNDPDLLLTIIGNIETIPLTIVKDPAVVVKGTIDQKSVIEIIASSKFYINTSLVENSWNAASEGVFLAKESYVSDIGPHRELLEGSQKKFLHDFGGKVPIIHIKKDDTAKNIKTWRYVIENMIDEIALHDNSLQPKKTTQNK